MNEISNRWVSSLSLVFNCSHLGVLFKRFDFKIGFILHLFVGLAWQAYYIQTDWYFKGYGRWSCISCFGEGRSGLINLYAFLASDAPIFTTEEVVPSTL